MMSFGNDGKGSETADDVVLKVFFQAARRMRVLRAERFRQRRQDDQAIDDDALADGVVAGVGDRSAGIVVAITGDIDDAPLRLEGRALELVHGEVDGAADRGAPGERSWRLDQPVTEAARSRAVPYQCPLDHDIVHAY